MTELATDTRDDAYHSLNLGPKQKAVYRKLRELEPNKHTNSEIAYTMGLPINCITGRIFELRELGLVQSAGKRKCRMTGRIAYTWEVVYQTAAAQVQESLETATAIQSTSESAQSAKSTVSL